MSIILHLVISFLSSFPHAVSPAITDEEIYSLANAIGDNQKLTSMGIKLGFGIPQIRIYKKMNRGGGGEITCEGTLNFFYDWQLKTKSAEIDQRTTLKEALVKAELGGLVEHLNKSGKNILTD